MSQRAFRARQSAHIKELEEQIKLIEKPDLHMARLEKENRTLRSQLLECHKKLESLIISMKKVSTSLSVATEIEVRDMV